MANYTITGLLTQPGQGSSSIETRTTDSYTEATGPLIALVLDRIRQHSGDNSNDLTSYRVDVLACGNTTISNTAWQFIRTELEGGITAGVVAQENVALERLRSAFPCVAETLTNPPTTPQSPRAGVTYTRLSGATFSELLSVDDSSTVAHATAKIRADMIAFHSSDPIVHAIAGGEPGQTPPGYTIEATYLPTTVPTSQGRELQTLLKAVGEI